MTTNDPNAPRSEESQHSPTEGSGSPQPSEPQSPRGPAGPPPWSGPSWPPPPYVQGPGSAPPPMPGVYGPGGMPPRAPYGGGGATPFGGPSPATRLGQPQPAPKKSGAGIGIIILIAGILLLLLAVVAGSFESSSRTSLVGGGNLKETIIEGTGDYKIAVVEINGMILDSSGGGLLGGASVNPVEFIDRSIERIDSDSTVKGMILRVNSPGGGITASDVIYNNLRTARARWANENRTMKVLVLMDDLAASGGYYISTQSDHIMAHPTTITGSIGVIMSRWNYAGLMEKFGIEDATVTSVDSKDLGSPFRQPEPFEDEFLKQMLTEMQQQFEEAVYEGRSKVVAGLKPADVAQWADGSIYTAKQALAVKMIDSIGYHDDAVAKLQAMIDPNVAPMVVRYDMPTPSLFGLGVESRMSTTDYAELLKLWLAERAKQTPASNPPVMAVWPGAMNLPRDSFLVPDFRAMPGDSR